MRRILLTSDTHGNIDEINIKITLTKADMVIHAGDFGFYDEESISRLSARELFLRVVHSPLGKNLHVDKTDRVKLAEIIEDNQLLGNFSDYLSGKKEFLVPVYAVWGNHEDIAVINRLREGLHVKNLYLLDENSFYEFKKNHQIEFALYGLGGNFIQDKLFGSTLSDNQGKIWSNLHQYGTLFKQVNSEVKPSIFVSHVSPGKEPLLSRLISHLSPDFWVSGHMESPFTSVWNQFAIREMDEACHWLKEKDALLEERHRSPIMSTETLRAYEILKKELSTATKHWYRNTWNINLPGIEEGYAMLTVDNGKFSLETRSCLSCPS